MLMLAGIQKRAFCLHRPVIASLELVRLGLDSGVPVAAPSMVRAAQTHPTPWMSICYLKSVMGQL